MGIFGNEFTPNYEILDNYYVFPKYKPTRTSTVFSLNLTEEQITSFFDNADRTLIPYCVGIRTDRSDRWYSETYPFYLQGLFLSPRRKEFNYFVESLRK